MARGLLIGIACLFALGVGSDLIGSEEADVALENSIYRSAEARDRLMEIYDERLADWSVAYEELDVETSYGRVHVVASGPVDGEPVLLFHASELSATSWGPNMEAFADCRTYAIDHIGEVNKSELKDVEIYPKTREEIVGLYVEIADALGVDRSIVVGASNGGFIAMSYTIAHPERVSRLILCGPMGLTSPPAEMGLRLVAAQFIHFQWIEQGTLRWVLGESPTVLGPYGEWFVTLIRGSFPRVVPPIGIPRDELATIEIPVLLFLGTKDNVVGDHRKASRAASAMRDIRTHVVDSAHLVNVEVASDVNRGILEFLHQASE